jgi:hypothetical protein
MEQQMLPEEQDQAPEGEETFHVWRLLGVIGLICVVLAIASFIVDWAVIGPLEGRVL